MPDGDVSLKDHLLAILAEREKQTALALAANRQLILVIIAAVGLIIAALKIK